jgi:hypothetical protein
VEVLGYRALNFAKAKNCVNTCRSAPASSTLAVTQAHNEHSAPEKLVDSNPFLRSRLCGNCACECCYQ